MGSDHLQGALQSDQLVSIHAPARGATIPHGVPLFRRPSGSKPSRSASGCGRRRCIIVASSCRCRRGAYCRPWLIGLAHRLDGSRVWSSRWWRVIVCSVPSSTRLCRSGRSAPTFGSFSDSAQQAMTHNSPCHPRMTCRSGCRDGPNCSQRIAAHVRCECVQQANSTSIAAGKMQLLSASSFRPRERCP